MADAESIRELMRRNIEELFATGDLDLIPEIYAPDWIDHNPAPGQRSGHDGIRDLLTAFHTAFPDQRMELHGTLADGEFGVDFWTFRATHLGELDGVAPTGRRVEFSGIDVARVVDGRIQEIWHVEDMTRMWAQIRAPR
jgi:predicted ester cyclase